MHNHAKMAGHAGSKIAAWMDNFFNGLICAAATMQGVSTSFVAHGAAGEMLEKIRGFFLAERKKKIASPKREHFGNWARVTFL